MSVVRSSIITSEATGMKYRLEEWFVQGYGIKRYGCDVLPMGSNEPIKTFASSRSCAVAKRSAEKWVENNR